jgi:mannose-6-phosphate isomerase-like protein (cupin superfamily)
MESFQEFHTKALLEKYNYLAPDGSEIRLLVELRGGGLCHCKLPEGKVSAAVYHKTVEELWYFLSGEGEVWRKHTDKEVSVSVPVGTAFQFRNTGRSPLCFVITTMPPWPGEDEAVPTDGKWKVTSG